MKHRFSSFTIIILFVILILCGIPLIYFINLEVVPSAISSSISVSFSWFGAEPRVIEGEATSRIEALIASVQGVKNIISKSGNESGNISVTLDKQANIEAVRFEISTLIRQIWPMLPVDVSFPILSVIRPNQENERPLLSYTLNAISNPNLVQKYAEDNLKPALSHIPGIYKVDIYGGTASGWIIEYDFEKLKAYGVSQQEIKQAVNIRLGKENLGVGSFSSLTIPVSHDTTTINSANANGHGVIATMPVVLQTSLNNEKEAQIESSLLAIPIKRSGERIILLKDLAKIKYTERKPQSYYRINGLNTINILIYASSGENNLIVGKKVKETLQQFCSALPPDYELLLSDDSTEYISHELQNIALRSLSTFLILLIFILLATRKWKHVFLILVMLLGNLSIAVIFYYLFKLEIHLYALAGITISLGLMTDNIIIMSDHLRTRGNRKVFLAILASTLTTVSSLVIIFFLGDQIKANLVDFALVIIINQSVSLLTALFVIPALMDILKLDKHHLQSGAIQLDNLPFVPDKILKNFEKRKIGAKHKREFIIRFTNSYRNVYLSLRKMKAIAIIIFILGFGLPLYMLPDKWEGDKWFNTAYNATIGNEWYKSKAKPWVGKIFGGALRLFTEKVFEGSYFSNPEETSLFISVSFPRGTTLTQSNAVIARMETYLKQFNEISLFQANVSARNSSITVYFKKEYQRSEFPYILKGQIVSKAVDIGSAYWNVYGFGEAFSNSRYETTGNYSIRMLGYNYDQLNTLAEKLRLNLSKNTRVKEVYVVSQRTWYKPDNIEFVAQFDQEVALVDNLEFQNTINMLQCWSTNQPEFNSLNSNKKIESIRINSKQGNEMDLWSLSHMPLEQDLGIYKLNNLFTIVKETTSPVISKENQQYIMFLQFEFIGADESARTYINNTLNDFKPQMSIGYTASILSDSRFLWEQQDNKQYWLLLLIVVIIFFICAVLFESLLQPFAVILTIPVGYIGIFLTFYLFGLNFDQGGFAALVILSGITVNAAIYILNDYNNLRRQYAGRHKSDINLYFKAFNYKIIPILLTVVSTVLGFIPFLIGEKQPFWFALAAGTIGGLLFSLLGIVFYLPLFLRIK
jgi:multidrug efflux pump subunit AcrB